MAHATSAPRVLARVVCVLSLASARGRHGFASAAPSATASRQCPSRPPPRARRACSPKAATARDGGSAEPGGAFEVHPVAGDGRCLFRSVAVAVALRDGGARPAPAEETREADRLRAAAVDGQADGGEARTQKSRLVGLWGAPMRNSPKVIFAVASIFKLYSPHVGGRTTS